MLHVMFLTICFDVVTGNYKDVLDLLPNGRYVPRCKHLQHFSNDNNCLQCSIHKIIPLVQFITYFNYVYELNKDISDAGVSIDQQPLLRKLAIGMAAFIGLNSLSCLILLWC